jgi:hypothetical protein
MENREKNIRLLKLFLSEKVVEGVCDYFIDADGEGPIQVIVVLDIDYIKDSNTEPGFIARRIREGVKQEIKKWMGFDVYVGSTSKKCEDKSITESVSPHVRRRLDFDVLKQEIDNIIDYELNFCDYSSVGEFIEEICDMLNERILDEIVASTHVKVSLKEKDDLYFYLLDTFGGYLIKKYKKRCNDGIIESKKKYIVTESQYNLILESQKYKQFFQEFIDTKLDDIRKSCKDDDVNYKLGVHCEKIQSIEKIEVINTRWITVRSSYHSKEQKYMNVEVIIYFSSTNRYGGFNPDDLIDDLSKMIRNSTSIPLTISYELTNTKTNFER